MIISFKFWALILEYWLGVYDRSLPELCQITDNCEFMWNRLAFFF